MDKIRIIIADDHPLFREGVVKTLSSVTDFEIVAEASDAASAIEISKELLPDIALLDVSMPGGGISAAQEIAGYCPVVKIIMLTVSEDESTVHEALAAGATGYVLKGVSGNDLVGAIRNIFMGESYITPSLAASLLKPSRQPTQDNSVHELTPREKDILLALSKGASNKEIADKLCMGERTVKHHMTNILAKLQLKNRVEAALFAQKNIDMK
ncbi:MAG: response regulator [Neptuniibacter sp.]